MTIFDYILLGFALLHFLLVMYGIGSLPYQIRKLGLYELKPICNIWWIFPLIVVYRVWG